MTDINEETTDAKTVTPIEFVDPDFADTNNYEPDDFANDDVPDLYVDFSSEEAASQSLAKRGELVYL